ncbi:MAG: S26 family signal peptidase [Deltaproteobacteria bacterium]|nr:S26 family signal peptidase [Deltaproteobacteria bacterium]
MNKNPIESRLKNGGPILVAYVGPSMNPTLKEPEILEIRPYGNRPLQAGDVVFFRSPGGHQAVVHRIVRFTPEGIITRGDNNRRDDAFVIRPQDIHGRVVAARQGRKKRAITGGRRGRLIGRLIPWKRLLDRNLSCLLHSFYQALTPWRFLTTLLPVGLRPRIVVFQHQGIGGPCILLGRRIIGRYDDRRQQWQIRRPFRLIVDVHNLPTGPFKRDL